MLTLTMLLTLTTAGAAEVTDAPPFLRGDIDLGYKADAMWLNLSEDDESVGRVTTEDHRLVARIAVGAAPRVSIFTEIPLTLQQRVSYTDPREMVFDPTTEQGSLQAGTELADGREAISTSGLSGVWLGLNGQPFSEAHGNRTTWLIEGAFRFANANNFWTVNDAGERGAGNGGTAWQLRTGFSTTRGIGRPYLEGTLRGERPIVVDLTDSAGNVITQDAEIRAASSVLLRTGVELVTFEDPSGSSWAVFDLRAGFGYHGDASVPSGVYLPTILPATEGELVTRSGYSSASGGLGFYWQVFEYMRIRLAGDLVWNSPFQLERPYPVYTDMRSFSMVLGAGVKVTIR